MKFLRSEVAEAVEKKGLKHMAETNLAYDLSVYEPKAVIEKKAAPVEEAAPEIKVKTNAKPDRSGFNALSVFLQAAVILVALFAVLFGNVETNMLFKEITQLEAELDALEAENIALAAQYETATSLKNVEDYAENVLGLRKLDKAQIEYVEMESDKVSERVDTDSQNVFITVRNWFTDVFEYLGL